MTNPFYSSGLQESDSTRVETAETAKTLERNLEAIDKVPLLERKREIVAGKPQLIERDIGELSLITESPAQQVATR